MKMEKILKKKDFFAMVALISLIAWLGKQFYAQLLRIEHSTVEIQHEMVELRASMLTRQDVIDIIHLEHEKTGCPLGQYNTKGGAK